MMWMRSEDGSTLCLRSSLARNLNLSLGTTQHDAAACRQSCQASEACNAWIFCWHPGGCDDGREFQPHVFPYQVPSSPLSVLIASQSDAVLSTSCDTFVTGANVSTTQFGQQMCIMLAAPKDHICSHAMCAMSPIAISMWVVHDRQACELYDLPDHTPLAVADHGPAFSSFSSGFLPRRGPLLPQPVMSAPAGQDRSFGPTTQRLLLLSPVRCAELMWACA